MAFAWMAIPAHAQAPAARDSLARAVTPVATRVAPIAGPPAPDTTSSDTAVVRRKPWTEQPRVVMLRSLIVPGWGQWHNHSYVKAAGIAGVEGSLIARVFVDKHQMDVLLAEVNAAKAALRVDSLPDVVARDQDRYTRSATSYNDRLNSYISGQWLVAAVLTYSLIDAYVDAHFRSFETDFRTDPALPPGESSAGPSSDAHPAPALRLAFRWRF
jgi:hypothetical protein